MKTIRIFGIRSVVLAIALSVGLGFVSPALAYTSVIVNPDGKVTFLDTLGGSSSVATDINDAGQVVGYSQSAGGSTHAFITGANGVGMTDLGTLGGTRSYANGINEAGQVVGFFVPPGGEPFSRRAFMTGPNGSGMTEIGSLAGSRSSAADINDAGQVVGYSSDHAFITGPNGVGMTDLGSTPSGTESQATGVNNSGQVVGFSYVFGGEGSWPFITGPDGVGMTLLGSGLPGYGSQATDINDSGQVVGYSVGNIAENMYLGLGGGTSAFMTGPDGEGVIDFGSGAAHGINDSGQVVGQLGSSGHAFVTGPNGEGMVDINSYAQLPEGFYLRFASDINNVGQVIAIISPIPEPASCALMLAGLGLVGFMARRKKPTKNTVECR